jgi:HK97 family phage prohead protease
METRSFEIRKTDTEKREVAGIAVPYDDTIDIGGGWSERFERGAIDLDADVKLFRDHKEIIGKVTDMSEDTDGLWITARISETTLGNETLELVKDGAIRSFSVGFIPVKDEKKDKTIIRKKVEVSLVAFPAYEAASVVEVREEVKEEIMTDNTTPNYDAAIAEVRDHAEALERRLDVLATSSVATPSVPEFRSYGSWVKGVASNNDDAVTLYRAFENAEAGSVLADSILKNAWVSDAIRILDMGRPTYNVFSTGTLPADGMTLEYPVLDTDTSTIDEQAAEADELAFGKITLTSATAPIKTYGGYTDMSRQVVERSSVAYVDAAFRAMIAAYSKKTNNVMKAYLTAEAANFNSGTLASYDADAVIEALADAAMKVNEDTGRALEFILCSSDVFKNLAKVVDAANRPILSNVGATSNTYGSINPVGLTGNIFGLPLVVDPSLAGSSLWIGNSAAVTSYESAGAPFRLNDEDITNLTQKFSVYGYLAIAGQDKKALVKVTV